MCAKTCLAQKLRATLREGGRMLELLLHIDSEVCSALIDPLNNLRDDLLDAEAWHAASVRSIR